MSGAITFEGVFHGDSPLIGKLRFNSAGLGWKPVEDDANSKLVTLSGSDIKAANWIRVARNFQLRLVTRQADKPRITFDGFKRDDTDKVRKILDDWYQVKLEIRDPSLKGWNWGKAEVQASDVAFLVQNKTAFEVPLSAVANSNIAGKNEVALEFVPPTPFAPVKSEKLGPSAKQPDELVEMRFYIPGRSVKAKRAESGSEGEEESERDEDGNEISAAQAFHDTIKDRAEIGVVAGDSLVVFNEVLVLTPRGRYDLDMYPTFLRLRGKTYDYKILHSSVNRIFLLPRLDDIHIQLVIGLDPPIRQGQTRYPFLVMQFAKDEEVDAELNISEEELAEKYSGSLQKKYEAPTFQVISQVFKALTGRRVTPPGSYKSTTNFSGIKCNVKAVQGELYFLEKGLIFIAKQPILVDFSAVDSITFSRVGGVSTARSFDMRVLMKSELEHSFTSIPKEEADGMRNYLLEKRCHVINELDESAMQVDINAILSDEDDEMASVAGTDDSRQRAPRGGDDEDSEEDEDFADGASSDGGSPTESDSDGGSAASDASDPMMEELKKKKARQQAKKAEAKKAAAAGGDGAASSEEESKPKKKKPKTDA